MPPTSTRLLNKLTEAKLKVLKPREKEFKVADGGGLYVKIHPNGSKYWRMKYRVAGKEKTLAFGTYPTITLKVARQKRDDAKRLLADNLDPKEEQNKSKQKALVQNTFESVALDWIAVKKGGWTERHAGKVHQSLINDVFPVLGQRPIDKITAAELLACIQQVSNRGAHDMAKRITQRCNSIFQHGQILGHCKANPAAGLQSVIPSPRKRHFACINRKEFPELIQKINAYQGESSVTRYALQLILFTFVRSSELRNATWDEFDLDSENPTWKIPAERMKKKRAHIVPLSRQALAILGELKSFDNNHGWLVPSYRKPEQPISENTLIYALYRMGYRSRMTVHGFRTLASTTLNEKQYPSDVIEKQLSHEDRDEIRSAYNRAEYMSQRIEMMQCWADYIDEISAMK